MTRYPGVSNSLQHHAHLHGLRHPVQVLLYPRLQRLSSVLASWAVCHSPAEIERASSRMRSRLESTPSPPQVGWGF